MKVRDGLAGVGGIEDETQVEGAAFASGEPQSRRRAAGKPLGVPTVRRGELELGGVEHAIHPATRLDLQVRLLQLVGHQKLLQ